MKKFELGQVVATKNCANTVFLADIQECLNRHQSGDWGDTEDAEMNEEALNPKYPDRIMSVYKFPEYTIWVITEWDRSSTTVLLPEDY